MDTSKKNHPLAQARIDKKMTLQKVVDATGLANRQYIWALEHGWYIPSRRTASALADLLGFEDGEVLRAACRAWVAEVARHSHRLVFAKEAEALRFLAVLPEPLTCVST